MALAIDLEIPRDRYPDGPVARALLQRALAGAGLVIGLAAALALSRLLKSQLFAVSPSDPATYVAAFALLLAAALFAALLPSRRATLIDPGVALRHERGPCLYHLTHVLDRTLIPL